MSGEDRRDDGVVERLTRQRDEALKEARVANRALRSVVLQDTKIEEIEGKITVDQTQEIGRDFARLMFGMLLSVEAANCLEWIVDHPTEGKFTLTLQRCAGKSPMELRNEERDRYQAVLDLIASVLSGGNSFDDLKSLLETQGVQDANNQSHDSWSGGSSPSDDATRQVGQEAVCGSEPGMVRPRPPLCEPAGGKAAES